MTTSYPTTIPETFAADERLTNAYRRGWNWGHGFACHNVPELYVEYWTQCEGRIKATDLTELRDLHFTLCYEAEQNGRQYSPFECTAAEFNDADENDSDALWTAFEAGTVDAIGADVGSYTAADYGLDD